MQSHAVLLTQLLKIRTALSIKPASLLDLRLRGWRLGLLFWEDDFKSDCLTVRSFWGTSAFRAGFCHTPHSQCELPHAPRSDHRRQRTASSGSHVSQQAGFHHHSSSSRRQKSVQGCCLLITVRYNTPCNTVGNPPVLQRDTI